MKKFKKVIQGIWFSLKLTFGMKEGAQYVVYKLFLTLLDNLVPLFLCDCPISVLHHFPGVRHSLYQLLSKADCAGKNVCGTEGIGQIRSQDFYHHLYV